LLRRKISEKMLGAGVDETVNAYKIWSKNLEKEKDN
jgi:hypothetical protein